MGRIHPDAEQTYFSKKPEVRAIAQPFLSGFDVTRGFTRTRGQDRLECLYLRGESLIEELIGLERELFVAYVPFPQFQAKYKIALRQTDEGYSVSVPGLPGCWSQVPSRRNRFRISRTRSRNTLPRATSFSRARWCVRLRSPPNPQRHPARLFGGDLGRPLPKPPPGRKGGAGDARARSTLLAAAGWTLDGRTGRAPRRARQSGRSGRRAPCGICGGCGILTAFSFSSWGGLP